VVLAWRSIIGYPLQAPGRPLLALEAWSRFETLHHTSYDHYKQLDANMADPEVATKAPESDAAEESKASLIPGDTLAQSGASLGVR
jgi:hypothetical protein